MLLSNMFKKWTVFPPKYYFWGNLILDTYVSNIIIKNGKGINYTNTQKKLMPILIYTFHFLLTAMPSTNIPESIMNNA